MGLAAFQRRRESAGDAKMQGDVEAGAKKEAASRVARGELPNPVDGDKPLPSSRQGKGGPRDAEEAWLGKHSVDGNDPPKSTAPGEEVVASAAIPEPGPSVDDAPKRTRAKQPASEKEG